MIHDILYDGVVYRIYPTTPKLDKDNLPDSESLTFLDLPSVMGALNGSQGNLINISKPKNDTLTIGGVATEEEIQTRLLEAPKDVKTKATQTFSNEILFIMITEEYKNYQKKKTKLNATRVELLGEVMVKLKIASFPELKKYLTELDLTNKDSLLG